MVMNRKIAYVLAFVLIVFAIIYFGLYFYTPKFLEIQYGQAGSVCGSHKGCRSGVCNHQKADFGSCASEVCSLGEKTDNNNFFCRDNKWYPSKRSGESCSDDFECFKQTCFMIPDCQLTDIPRTKAFCKNNVCVQEVEKDECELQGLKRVLRKDQFMGQEQGECFESVAQMVLPTICAPCGNGVCDAELESVCNCPEDCK